MVIIVNVKRTHKELVYMKNNTRKIVVLDNINSSRIEQAIFILRDTSQICESDAVTEAQRIVNTYLNSLSQPLLQTKKKKRLSARFFIAMTLYTFSTIIITAYLLTLAH